MFQVSLGIMSYFVQVKPKRKSNILFLVLSGGIDVPDMFASKADPISKELIIDLRGFLHYDRMQAQCA